MTQIASLPVAHRIYQHFVSEPQALPESFKRVYSRMKYGDPIAVDEIAAGLTQGLLSDTEFNQVKDCYIASSAYGAIPAASHAIMLAVSKRLAAAGVQTTVIKIHRANGFAQTNYGQLSPKLRASSMRHRTISIDQEDCARLGGKCLLVVDDLRATGEHERALEGVFSEIGLARVFFAYPVGFQETLSANQPEFEHELNQYAVKNLRDVRDLFSDPSQPPILNARLVKFVLEEGTKLPVKLDELLGGLAPEICIQLFKAALCRDGYQRHDKFRRGFVILKSKCQAQMINAAHSLAVVETKSNGLSLADMDMSESQYWLDLYSRFKFGDVQAIETFAEALSIKLISELETETSPLRHMFEHAKLRNEHIYLIAPGIRNVVSASNFLLRETGLRLNVWLSRQGLPTAIMRTLPRLGSGRANYAELTAKQRQTRPKTTQTLLPESDFQAHPIHVIFIDDMISSGVTAMRAQTACFSAGALSFHACVLLKTSIAGAENPEIENDLNMFTVKGGLSSSVLGMLQHPDYQPVQRLLRLLLHPRNLSGLDSFLGKVPDKILRRLYFSAMSNDYLWIDRGETHGDDSYGLYGTSLDQLARFLESQELLKSQSK